MNKKTIHPTIQKFLDEHESLDLGITDYEFEYESNIIRLTSRIEVNNFMPPLARAIGFFLVFMIIGWFRNIMNEWFGVPGLWINSILLFAAFSPVAFFGGKAFFLAIKYFLSGGEEGPGMIDIEFRIEGSELHYSSLLRQDLKPWAKFIAYFKRVHE